MTTPAWNAVLTIAGVDQSDHLEGFGATIVLSEDRSSASFVLLDHIPLVGQLVSITNGEDVFRGRVSTIATSYRRNAALQCQVSCDDLATIFDSRLVHGNFIGYKTGEIIRALMLTFFPHEGIEYYSKVSDGVDAPDFIFSYKTMTQALMRLCDYSGYIWNVDREGCLVYAPANPTSSVTITDADVAEVSVKASTVGYRNRQYVLGGGAETKPITVKQPRSSSYTMPFPLAQAPRIWVNDVEVPSTSIGVRGLQTERQWQWAYNEESVTFNSRSSTEDPLDEEGDPALETTEDVSISDTVTIKFIGLAPTMSLVEDEGGQEDYGVYESYLPLTHLNSAESIEQAAVALLAKNVMPENVTVKTFSPVLMPNMGATINISGLEINGVHRVSRTTIYDLGDVASYSSDLCVGANDPWRLFFSQLADGCRPEVSTEELPELEKPVETLSLTDAWSAPYVGPMVAYVDYEDRVHHPAHIGFVEYLPDNIKVVAEGMLCVDFAVAEAGLGTVFVLEDVLTTPDVMVPAIMVCAVDDYAVGDDLYIGTLLDHAWLEAVGLSESVFAVPSRWLEDGFSTADGLTTEIIYPIVETECVSDNMVLGALLTVEVASRAYFGETLSHLPAQVFCEEMSPADAQSYQVKHLLSDGEEVGDVAEVSYLINKTVLDPVYTSDGSLVNPGGLYTDAFAPTDSTAFNLGQHLGDVLIPYDGLLVESCYNVAVLDPTTLSENCGASTLYNIVDNFTIPEDSTTLMAMFQELSPIVIDATAELYSTIHIALSDATAESDNCYTGSCIQLADGVPTGAELDVNLIQTLVDDESPADGLTSLVGLSLISAVVETDKVSAGPLINAMDGQTAADSIAVNLRVPQVDVSEVAEVLFASMLKNVAVQSGVSTSDSTFIGIGWLPTENLSPNELMNRAVTLSASDEAAVRDATELATVNVVTLNDKPLLSETVFSGPGLVVTESASTADTMSMASRVFSGNVDALGAGDEHSVNLRTYQVDLAQVVDSTETGIRCPLLDGFSPNDSKMVNINLPQIDGFSVRDSMLRNTLQTRAFGDRVYLGEVIKEKPTNKMKDALTIGFNAPAMATRCVLTDTHSAGDSLSIVATAYTAITDGVSWSETCTNPAGLRPTDTLTTGDVLASQFVPKPTETLEPRDVLIPAITRLQALASTMAFSDSLSVVSLLKTWPVAKTDPVYFSDSLIVASILKTWPVAKTEYPPNLVESLSIVSKSSLSATYNVQVYDKTHYTESVGCGPNLTDAVTMGNTVVVRGYIGTNPTSYITYNVS